jgi:hypothetical protein
MAADIQARGIDQPLCVDPQNRIMDGRRRWLAAKVAGLAQVPCIRKDEDEAPAIIVAAVVHRQQWNKNQLAYLTYPMVAELHEKARVQKGEVWRRNFRKCLETSVRQQKASGEKRVEEIAAVVGVGERTFRDAARVREIFEQDPVYKAEMEPRILAQDSTLLLWHVVAGYGGMKETKGQPKRRCTEEIRLLMGLKTFVLRAMRFSTAKAAREIVQESIRGMTDKDDLVRTMELGEEMREAAKAQLKALS